MFYFDASIVKVLSAIIDFNYSSSHLYRLYLLKVYPSDLLRLDWNFNFFLQYMCYLEMKKVFIKLVSCIIWIGLLRLFSQEYHSLGFRKDYGNSYRARHGQIYQLFFTILAFLDLFSDP